VFPKTLLPQPVFAASIGLEMKTRGDNVARKQSFDALPSRREIGVVRRQSHHCMQMLGKDYDGIDSEGALASRFSKYRTKMSDVLGQHP